MGRHDAAATLVRWGFAIMPRDEVPRRAMSVTIITSAHTRRAGGKIRGCGAVSGKEIKKTLWHQVCD